MKNLIDKLLDLTIIWSFDQTGFKRHCPYPLEKTELSDRYGIITGASSGIGLAGAKELIQQGMSCTLVARHPEKIQDNVALSKSNTQALDMSHLRSVYSFAVNNVKDIFDLIIHNAGAMPSELQITEEGFEQMFASQVLGPFILTKALLEAGKLKQDCRIIFISSGGMYLQKLDLSDLLFKKRTYNKYSGYANSKRAQVILAELFSNKFPEYLFSAMHPGWVDTPGVRNSMPLFRKIIGKRLRSPEQGADTILWLATTSDYPNGKFWFDRKQAKTTIFNFNQSDKNEKEALWNYCESVFSLIKSQCI